MLRLENLAIFRGIGRRLLLWLSLFFLIPLVTVGYAGYLQSKNTIRKNVFDHFESILHLQSEALQNDLQNKELQLAAAVTNNEFLLISSVVLQSPTFSSVEIESARSRLQKYLQEKNQELGALGLWVTGKEGNVIAASEPQRVGEDRRNSPETALFRQAPSMVHSLYTETERRPEILIAAPIDSPEGESIGLFTMTVNFANIYRILGNRTGLGETGETYLVNPQGDLISPSRHLPNAVMNQKVSLREIYEYMDWRDSDAYALSYRGVPVIQAHTHLPFFDWILISEMEASEAFRELGFLRKRTIAMVLALFSVLVVTAALIAQNLTQPIRVLAEAARRVGEGSLSEAVEVKGNDELAELATEFNSMTRKLRVSKEKMDDWSTTIQREVELRTEELKNSELKFRTLMENANDAIMIFDTDRGHCTLANLKAQVLTGYCHSELLGKTLADFLLPEHVDFAAKLIREALEKGASNLYNVPIQRKDRREVYVDISNSLIVFQQDRFLNCIIHDVTEQRRMERQRISVSHISDIIATSSDLDLILNKSIETILSTLELEVGAVFLYDDEAQELLLHCYRGYARRFEADFARQNVKPNTRMACAKAAFTGEVQYMQNPFKEQMAVYLEPDVDANKLNFILGLPLVAEGTLVGVLQVITNQTKGFMSEDLLLLEALANQLAAGILRLKLEQAKHQDDQFLASILTESLDAIISMDAQYRITSWNRGAERIFHLKKEKALGLTFPSLFMVPALVNQEKIHQKLEEKGFVKDYELENVGRDGRELTLQLSQTAIRDKTGKFCGSSAIIRDITAQKEMEKWIQRSERLSSVGHLAAGIAHEIGTPLNIISGNAEYLMMGLDKSDPKMEELSIIVDQTDRIASLIQQMMDFARNTEPRLEETDVNQIIEDTLGMTRHHFTKHGITLSTRLDGVLPKIVADPYQLQQVILNMIFNAVHAMPEGGRLAMETTVDRSKKTVQIRIMDTGKGIPPEEMKNIFNPFYTTKDVGEGTGLGLSVSHRIIEDHHGRIDVDSRVGEGTCFTLILPIRTGSPVSEAEHDIAYRIDGSIS
ncbi:MAG: PAS domain S-box protein [bacterium]|nr:PAS domain S-box protein [bacterium]